MAKTSDYSKFVIASKPDPSSGEFALYDYNKDFKAFEQAVKSSLPEGAFFQIKPKEVNKTTGQGTLEIVVHSAYANVVEEGIAGKGAKLLYDKGGEKYDISSPQALNRHEAREAWIEENKKDNEAIRFNRGTLLKIVGAITALTDVTRRILSSVLSFSQRTAKDMITANNLGMSYESARQARHVETIHGLKEGTITEAVADVQSKFGNITALDEGALESLALVMGGKIQEMVEMGLGSSNPEKVLGSILDAFNEKANAGYNSIGQYVGEAQARRELYSYLQKISPQIADLFAVMQEEQHNINSIFKDKFGNFEDWRYKLFPTERNEPSPTQKNMLAVTSQEWNLAKEVLNQIEQALLISLIPAVLKIARFVSNLRIGMSEGEKERLNAENYAKNEAFIASAGKTISLMEKNESNLTPEQRARMTVLKEARDRAIKENKKEGDIADVSYTALEVQYATEAQIKRDAKSAESKAKWAMSNIDPDKKYTDEELKQMEMLPDVTDADIADTLEGYPAKKKELEAKYATAKKEYANEMEGERKRAVEDKKKQKRKELEYEVNTGKAYELISDTQIMKEVGTNGMLNANLRTLQLASKIANIDLFHDDKGNPLDFKQAVSKAKSKKLISIDKFGKFSIKDNVDVQLSAEELNQIMSDYSTEYPYNFYDFAYRAETMLFNKSLTDKKYRASQKASLLDPYQDIYTVFGKYGGNLEKLAYLLPSGTYTGEVRNIRSTETNENGIYTHKIICDITTNGKTVVKDFVLDTGKNITAGFQGTHTDVLKINANGNSTSQILSVEQSKD